MKKLIKKIFQYNKIDEIRNNVSKIEGLIPFIDKINHYFLNEDFQPMNGRNSKNQINNKILIVISNNFLKNHAGNNTYVYSIVKTLKKMGFLIDALSSNYYLPHDFDNFINLNREEKLINKFYISKSSKRENYKYSLNSWCNDEMVDIFKRILKINKYSYVVINYIFFTDLIRFSDISHVHKIINIFHDCDTLQNFYQNKIIGDLNRFEYISKVLENEIKLLSYYDDVFCISSDEKYFFSKFLEKTSFYWLPFCCKSKSFDTTFEQKSIDCLFVGYSNCYNMESIMWFYKNVYNYLPKNTKIVVCGLVSAMLKNNKLDIYNDMVHDGFIFYDYVEDIDELYKKSKISIVPMIGGTGLKIKTVSSLSRGIPVVGTTAAIDGFPDKISNCCFTSNNAIEFANFIIDLISNKKHYLKACRETNKYYNKIFSMKSFYDTLSLVFKVLK